MGGTWSEKPCVGMFEGKGSLIVEREGCVISRGSGGAPGSQQKKSPGSGKREKKGASP